MDAWRLFQGVHSNGFLNTGLILYSIFYVLKKRKCLHYNLFLLVTFLEYSLNIF